ncbi:MAG: HisA/HisF-related TIM barrel protein [Gammaproteobacteria bacterium]
MQIIPVIDLKNGHVVRAVQGNRAQYQPIHSPLCQSSAIKDVIEAFLNLYPFRAIYIADINALTGTGHHFDQISEVLARYPALDFWLDAGFTDYPEQYAAYANCIPIIASEVLHKNALMHLNDLKGRYILSLDFLGDTPLGAEEVFLNPRVWPDTVIIMTLSQVGSNLGPDFQKLTDYRRRFGDKEFVAAGGIRNRTDLTYLKKTGIRHALIASALHSGAIRTSDIAALD